MEILIADDHALIREALHHVLQELENNTIVIEAADGESARRLVASHPNLDLALLDLKLPGVNGLELLTELRNSYPDLPIVVLSAVEDTSTMRTVLEHGAMGFIPKSSSNRVTLSALQLVLSGGRYLPPELFAASPAASRSSLDVKLTGRQRDVLKLMMKGHSNKEICRELGLAEPTVKIHVTAILRALQVTSRAQAIVAINRFDLSLDGPDEPAGPALR